MKSKLWLSFILVGTLIMPHSLWASEEESQRLTQIIQEVKQKVDVPEALSEFEYHKRGDSYYLTWEDQQNEKQILVISEADGDIVEYRNYDSSRTQSQLSTLSYRQALSTAKAFLQKIAPEYADKLENFSDEMPSKSDTYKFKFNLMQDGIRVYGKQIFMGVDKKTGQVAYMNGFNYDEAAQYTVSKPNLTKAQAEEKYNEIINIPLYYEGYSSYDGKEKKVFLAYRLNNSRQLGVNALTGEKVELTLEDAHLYDREMTTGAMDTQEIAADKGADIVLTPEESKKVAETKSFLSVEAIKQKAESFFPALKGMQVTESSIYQQNNQYMRRITFKQEKGEQVYMARLSVNAQTGEIMAYHYMDKASVMTMSPKKTSTLTDEQAKAFIRRIAPEQSLEEMHLEKETTPLGEDEQYDTYTFNRFKDGVPVADNQISLSYDKSLGAITDYEKTWETLNFPSQKGILDASAVVRSLNLSLYYLQTDTHQYQLAYYYDGGQHLFDAFTAQPIDYRGEVIKEEKVSFYTDIKGHPQEQLMTELYYSGIYLDGPILKPNAAITQKELLRLIMQATSYYNEESLYKNAYELGILTKEEAAPTKVLTKGEAIKYIISATDYKKIAAMPKLYDYPFKETQGTEELKGYITIAYGLNILTGDDFKPEEKLTKAEAMRYIYLFLQSDNA